MKALLLLVFGQVAVSFLHPSPLRRHTWIQAIDMPVENLKAKEIKEELRSRGWPTDGLFDRESLVAALVKARASPPRTQPSPTPPRTQSSPSPTAPSETQELNDEKTTIMDATVVEATIVDEVKSEPTPTSVESTQPIDEESIRSEIQGMKVSEMKSELRAKRVNMAGMLEKSEFVEALVTARIKAMESGEDVRSGEFRDVEVQKYAPEDGPAGKASDGMPGGGMPGGGMGGLGDMLKGMGGMGGMPGGMGGVPGDMGGIADILKGMGGMPGGMGGMPGGMGGMPGGMGGMQDMMSKLMSNPKAMAAVQKAQSNPRIMQIVQECMSNPAAMQKYKDDPEMKEIIEALRGII